MRAVCAASEPGALPAVVSHGTTVRVAPVVALPRSSDCARANPRDFQSSNTGEGRKRPFSQEGWPMSRVRSAAVVRRLSALDRLHRLPLITAA